MITEGSFRKCLNKLIEIMGVDVHRKLGIVYEVQKSKYVLVEYEDVPNTIRKGEGEQYRLVLNIRFAEAKEICMGRQMTMFEGDKNVDN